jgi:glycosyltransferase 2 family protein
VLIADLSTLIPFLVAGMVSLALRHALEMYDIIGGAIFVIFVGGLCGGLFLAKWKPAGLLRLLLGAERLIDRLGSWLKRPHLLSEDWAERNAAEFTAATEVLRHRPRRLASLLGLGLLVHFISLAGLYASFQAYRQPIALGPLTAGFGMGIVFWVIALVPQGVGATEGIMSLVFTSLGIPRAKAITIVLVFRGASFYLPLIIGFFCLRHARAFGVVKEREADTLI